MHDGSQGIARPYAGAREHAHCFCDGYDTSSDQPEPCPGGALCPSLDELERALYVGQFIAIQRDNKGRKVRDLDTLRTAVACGHTASAGGLLAPCLSAADVDAATAAVGDAAVRELLEWCVVRGLPYLLRKSGRPGGRHLITVLNSAAAAAEWHQLCAEIAARLGTVVDDRTGQVLRLLSAPHRQGLPSEIVVNTITPAAVAEAMAAWDGPPPRESPSRGQRRSRNYDSGSRSEGEFGHACALARAGYDTATAWTAAATKGSKARDNGKQWWLRYAWLYAVTIVAAEEGLTEVKAWARAKDACPAISRELNWWRGLWRQALADAKLDRPRRRRLERTCATRGANHDTPEVRALRAGLNAAVQDLADLDTRHRKSVAAVLYAIAPALATREGSISLRDLSLLSLMALSTVRRALATLTDRRLLEIDRAYAGGADDCTAYRIGPAAESYVIAAQGNAHTSQDTPRPLGRSSPTRLAAQYARARAYWRARCDALAALAPGERLADSQHPAAKLMRSLWFQRRWWATLSAREQEERRAARREMLQQLHASERKAWFCWLDRRNDITAAADRLRDHTETPDDVETVLNAPLTIYRGMRDPQWRRAGLTASVRRVTTDQPELCAA